MRRIVFVLDDARPASSPSTRSRRRPAWEVPCPGLGSTGLALGGATFRGSLLGKDPGPIIDPELLWWRSRGPLSVRREPAPPEVVHRRVREEDEHVRRYMAAMDVRFSNTWQGLWGVDRSYDLVMVPSL